MERHTILQLRMLQLTMYTERMILLNTDLTIILLEF